MARLGFGTSIIRMATEKKSPVDLENICGIKLKSKMSSWMAHDADVANETVTRQYNLDASERAFEQIVDFFRFDSGTVRNVVSWYLLCDSTDGSSTASTTRSSRSRSSTRCSTNVISPWACTGSSA